MSADIQHNQLPRKSEISIMQSDGSHKLNPNSNTLQDGSYKIGDYVYFDTDPTIPYKISKIEEIIRGENNINVKVQSFCRRRDIPTSCQQLADKHVRELEEELYENQYTELSELERHQLLHREVYMSRSTGVDTGFGLVFFGGGYLAKKFYIFKKNFLSA